MQGMTLCHGSDAPWPPEREKPVKIQSGCCIEMNLGVLCRWTERQSVLPRRLAAAILAIALVLGNAALAQSLQAVEPASKRPKSIAVSEFSRLVQEFSEEGGYFRADNFTSNETAYLHVVGELRKLGVSGGAYVGVGPEQNFTYIAKIRPGIAFIVDIRRQAIIQHLFYKALFHLAPDRARFLSLLFSKPLSSGGSEAVGSLEALLDYISSAPTTRDLFIANLARVRKTIEEAFQLPLSPDDVESLEYIYFFFWRANLRIAYGYGFASLRDLILATDLEGKRGNFLAEEADYQFVRELQEQNRVIPVVGDFAGGKALAAVAGYLRQNGYTTSAFYTSNVEEYLYQDGAFGRFAENVGKFPISDRSVFIRSLRPGWADSHPANTRGDSRMSILEKISIFLRDYKQGAYPNYWKLVTTHYIVPTVSPRKPANPPAWR